MKSSIHSIGDSLKNILKGYHFEDEYYQNYILKNWDSIVPETIVKICKPVQIDQGVLYLNVASDAWKKELLNRKQHLIAIINNRIEKSFITDLAIK
jgi:predicted nucleic acid-binding Zn ribbon protein